MSRQLDFGYAFNDLSTLILVGDRLLLADRLRTPHYLVFNRRTNTVERSFGSHGKNPGSFIEPTCASVASHALATVWLFDKKLGRLSFVQLNAPRLLLEHVDLERRPGTMCAFWSKGRIIAAGYYQRAVFNEHNRNGRYLQSIGKAPFNTGPVLNFYAIAVEASTQRSAVAYRYTSQVEMYSQHGMLTARSVGPVETELRTMERGQAAPDGPRLLDPDDAKTESAYLDVAATPRFVYALFCGCRWTRPWQLAHEVHVFDWSGILVANLLLDRGVSQIAVDSANTLLVAAYHVSDTSRPLLGEWRLPRWLVDSRGTEFALQESQHNALAPADSSSNDFR